MLRPLPGCSARLDEALAKARTACEEMDKNVKEAAQGHGREALASLLNSAGAQLQAKADVLLEGFRTELQSSLDALESQVEGGF